LKQEYHDRDLPTYTEMILGLPEETYDTFVSGLDQAMTSRLSDHWVVHVCTLLQNTEMESDEYRKQYGLESRFVEAAIARRLIEDDVDQDGEIEEIVVGTKAMPCEDWQRAFAIGFVSSALYNFRAAFFLMNYLGIVCGNAHTRFVEHVIEAVEAVPKSYPCIARGVEHVRHQCAMIMDSISFMSSIEELGGATALTHEAAFAKVMAEPENFYRDLRKLSVDYLKQNDVEPDLGVLDDVLSYQHARMPLWGRPGKTDISFKHNVPAFFDAVAKGRDAPDIEPGVWEMQVLQKATPSEDAHAFAIQRTRSGHTIYLNSVTYHQSGSDSLSALDRAS